MFDFIQRSYCAAASRLDLWRYRVETRAKRLSRAWRYFTGRLSVDDAQTVSRSTSPIGRSRSITTSVSSTPPIRNTCFGGAAMGHCYHHALSSVKKWGGIADDYLALHQWFDESKMIIADFRHRRSGIPPRRVTSSRRLFERTDVSSGGLSGQLSRERDVS
jgi:hypothetical protein